MQLDMLPQRTVRQLLAMSILLAGFTPYLAAQLNADSVYRGA
jgi:hypothetical protein